MLHCNYDRDFQRKSLTSLSHSLSPSLTLLLFLSLFPFLLVFQNFYIKYNICYFTCIHISSYLKLLTYVGTHILRLVLYFVMVVRSSKIVKGKVDIMRRVDVSVCDKTKDSGVGLKRIISYGIFTLVCHTREHRRNKTSCISKTLSRS